MIRVKIDGKPQNVATSWGDVTFKNWLNYIEAGDDQTKIWSVILNMPYEKLKGANLSGNLAPLLKAQKFLTTPPVLEPTPTKLGGYVIKQVIQEETVEKYEACLAEMRRVLELPLVEQNRATAVYAAIYCQPNKEHLDMEQVGYLAKQFEEYPCLEVMSAGLFFSVRLQSLRTGLPVSYLTRDIPMRRSRLDLRGYRWRSGFTRLSIMWHVMWEKLMKK